MIKSKNLKKRNALYILWQKLLLVPYTHFPNLS